MGQVQLAEWRARRRQELTLPSGLTVVVRRLGLLDVVAEGNLPMPLLALVDEAQQAGAAEFGLADLPRVMPLIDAAVRRAVVEPPVADEPDETHLGLRELSVEDRLAIFNWLTGAAAALAPFRAQSGGAVAAGPGGAGV